MPNYEKSIIYKLCCKDTNIKEIYIGSTTNFKRRKCQHKTNCINNNAKGYETYKYKYIRNNGKWENWDMIQIKEISVNSKLELQAEERKTIEELKPLLNMSIPLRTKSEYYKDNKESMLINSKIYRDKYKVINKQYDKMYDENYYICHCGKYVMKRNKWRHEKSKSCLCITNVSSHFVND